MLGFLNSCMCFKYTFVTPGMVNKNNLDKHNRVFSEVSYEISNTTNSSYEVIGHGIGSWRYYPMGINRKGLVYGNGYANKKTPAKDIIDLIDTSIAIDPKMSIELDVHFAPDNYDTKQLLPKGQAYIIHDKPKWHKKRLKHPKAINYLKNNSLKIALDHFVKNMYYKTSKVYIEIKTDENCIKIQSQDIECKDQCIKLAEELKDYAKKYSRDDGENWLCITSFSPAALTSFRENLPENRKNRFDYVLIAGYTGGWPKSAIAQSKGHVPKFDDYISKFIENTEWLDCIWFSIQGIKDFNKEFNEIIKTRMTNHPNWKELEFSFSTYQYKQKKMVKRLKKTPKLQAKIRSFMLDLDHNIN